MNNIVTLDFTNKYDRETTLTHLRQGCGRECSVIATLAAEIEAQTKPARIPEPEVALAEVEASTTGRDRRRFVRGFGTYVRAARWVDGVFSFSWDELIDPVLIRDGIEDAS